MGILQDIENKLNQIDSATFQNLCDTFLVRKHSNYHEYLRIGSQFGKTKTIKGTPDTRILNENGKFILVEYSTNESEGESKLIKDVRKCLDENKTGITNSQIEEVILCVNFKLKSREKLSQLAQSYNIALSIHELGSLSIELFSNHRDLADEFLGVPLGTGQVVTKERFVKEYNRCAEYFSTQIDNTFLYREKELKELRVSFNEYDYVVLSGAPGVGKTKLAIEAIGIFLNENPSYNEFCISYKSYDLLEDLHRLLNMNNNYILFVDDAFRNDHFKQILGFYRTIRRGNLKILITVRDYTYEEFIAQNHGFLHKKILVEKFKDEEITDILKEEPFKILNRDYLTKIHTIADGNARLAIMTAKLAIEKQDINALNDVSDLFKEYFRTLVRDNKELEKKQTKQCLGVIAFFHVINYNNKQETESLLANFNIEYSVFIKVVEFLEKIEIVQCQFGHVKISEQNLSMYFFYRAFIEEENLSFGDLLRQYFHSHSSRFKECVITSNNTYGHPRVKDKLRPFLIEYLRQIKGDSELVLKFFAEFWYYLQDELLESCSNFLNSTEIPLHAVYEYSENKRYTKYDLLKILGNLLRYNKILKDVLEIGFEYVKREPDSLSLWVHTLIERLSFDRKDEEYSAPYQRQEILITYICEEVFQKGSLFRACFYELMKKFIGFKFHQTQGGRNNTFVWYNYTVPNNTHIQGIRKRMWGCLSENFDKNPECSFGVLLSYKDSVSDVNKEIVEFDFDYVCEIISHHLSVSSFEHCDYVQEQIVKWQLYSIVDSRMINLRSNFTNNLYVLSKELDWNYMKGKEIFEVEYDARFDYNIERIRSNFLFSDESEVRSFYENYTLVLSNVKYKHDLIRTFSYIVDLNMEYNSEIGFLLLKIIIESHNCVDYSPSFQLFVNLKSEANVERVWILFKDSMFVGIEEFTLRFIDSMESNFLRQKHLDSFFKIISNSKIFFTLYFKRSLEFNQIEPNFFVKLLRLVVEQNKIKESKVFFLYDTFDENFGFFRHDVELLKEAYLQHLSSDNLFDLESKTFIKIVRLDRSFFFEYFLSIVGDEKFDNRNLRIVWELDEAQALLKELFDNVSNSEQYEFWGLSKHFTNCFFEDLKNDELERATKFLTSYCRENINSPARVNLVVDIVRNTMKKLFEDILLLFLSLNHDVDVFKRIAWCGNMHVSWGSVADIFLSEWMNIKRIVEMTGQNYKLIPIKGYVSERLDGAKRESEYEKLRDFKENQH